jgi:hypothetical protein
MIRKAASDVNAVKFYASDDQRETGFSRAFAKGVERFSCVNLIFIFPKNVLFNQNGFVATS